MNFLAPYCLHTVCVVNASLSKNFFHVNNFICTLSLAFVLDLHTAQPGDAETVNNF